MTGARHGNTVPTLCAVCGQEIPAGVGRFVVGESGGRTFVHGGPCAAKVGAVPGGPATWGEIAELTAAALRGAAPVVHYPKDGGS